MFTKRYIDIGKTIHTYRNISINVPWTSDAHLLQWTEPSSVKIMDRHLFGDKPISLNQCWLIVSRTTWEQVTSELKCKSFDASEWNCKSRLRNNAYFVSPSACYIEWVQWTIMQLRYQMGIVWCLQTKVLGIRKNSHNWYQGSLLLTWFNFKAADDDAGKLQSVLLKRLYLLHICIF